MKVQTNQNLQSLRKLTQANKNKYSALDIVYHTVQEGELFGHENLKISQIYTYNSRCGSSNCKILVINLEDIKRIKEEIKLQEENKYVKD